MDSEEVVYHAIQRAKKRHPLLVLILLPALVIIGGIGAIMVCS